MSDNIHIKLPDGSEKEVPKGTTALDVAKSISPRLADATIVAKVRPVGRDGNGSSRKNQNRAGQEGRPYSQALDSDGAASSFRMATPSIV